MKCKGELHSPEKKIFMKTKFLISVLITLLSFASCTKRSEKTINVVPKNNEIFEKYTENFDEKSDENFEVFFEKFKTDTTFQLSRVVFPLEKTEWGFWSREPHRVILIDLESFQFINILTIELFSVEITKKSENEYLVTNESAILRQSTDYFFKECGGKWYLVKIEHTIRAIVDITPYPYD